MSYNPIIEYYSLIESGKEIVSEKVRRIYKKLVSDIDDKESIYEYDSKKANHAIEFIENFCKHSKGKWGGKPIVLEVWQKAFIAAAFGFVHGIDGTRKYREVLLVVARKNGKSTVGSGIGLYLQIADGEPGSEVYAVATKKDQAKLVWLESKRMVKKSPALLKRIKPLVSEMVSEWNDSTFKPLGSDSETLDGLNVHGAMMDEIHAWKDKNLYDVIVDGTSSREQPMIFMITTAGTVRESVYDMKYEEAEMLLNGLDDPDGYKDDRFLPIIYELDKREEWTDPSKWKKANPGLGSIKKIDQLETKVNKAKANSLLVKNLLTKDFNIRETSTEAWLTFEQLNNPETFDIEKLKPSYGIGGCDLSSTTDLTAAKVIFMVPEDPHIYVKQMYWLPEDLLEQRSKEDKIPYNLWHEQGILRTTPGNSVHYKFVTKWFLEIRDEYGIYLPWIGYDKWSAKYWVEEMEGYFGKESMIPIAQGKQTLSSPMKLLGADLESKLINYNNHTIDKWCLSNTAIDVDKNLNIQPNKTKNQRRRIDGTAALLNAYVVLQEKRNDYLNMI
ncbi:prophage lambdaba01, terminase, large subunit, putative [Bacillus anthracis]|uniref:Terminase n=1 Tax=Bacillus anthracis TaxID=1392 RepID=A0A640LGU7_BACAN|nr:putative prophage LambdaBa01, terminase, large subunit [Bacillus anthracis str. CDC 684]ACQ50486.1 putative prophage LambdaBa01, terminase, large subunit [Bacillus anthracis str. A0248]AFH84991.1 Prophage LambdaBa01, terminase, large subunit [Bacillus anthracis str. H9401]AHK39764.1 Prophage LambdaBa01, terminase, large subunit [Bacillus anthracis str. SVA11]AIM07504.1 prophage lambdaba01, terminase, large subunit, putative [Bacillus anthracis]EDR16751.1 putative prophage LambdaBa01, termin